MTLSRYDIFIGEYVDKTLVDSCANYANWKLWTLPLLLAKYCRSEAKQAATKIATGLQMRLYLIFDKSLPKKTNSGPTPVERPESLPCPLTHPTQATLLLPHSSTP